MALRIFLGFGAILVLAILVWRIWDAERQLPEITSLAEDGFRDLVFAITSDTVTADDTRTIDVAGLSGAKRVGFKVLIASAWKTLDTGEPDVVLLSGVITLESTGPDSDAFVTALDAIYGTRLAPAAMRHSIRCAAIALQGDPTALSDGITKIKIFFEPEDESRYAEAYLDFDLANRRMHLNEKDPEYRAPLVRALSQEPAT